MSLRLTRQPIAAIAWQLSYNSPQAFSREFKKHFSLSPRGYHYAVRWDTVLLLRKFDPEDENLPQARFCLLPEKVYRGSPVKYELRLSDMVLQSTSGMAVRQKVDRLFTAGGGRLSVLPDYYAASNDELNVEVSAFAGRHRERGALPTLTTGSTLTTRPGLYVGVEFYGNWARYARLPNDLCMESLPTLGTNRREGVDIECFLERHTGGGPAAKRRYRVRYFIPVTLSGEATMRPAPG